MISEPYICIKGKYAGEIQWFSWEGERPVKTCDLTSGTEWDDTNCEWQPYADLEREKLYTLRSYIVIHGHGSESFSIVRNGVSWSGGILIGYSGTDYESDSESSRILKRADFLKAVCGEEGVEWLPKEKFTKVRKTCDECGAKYHGPECPRTLCKALDKPPQESGEEKSPCTKPIHCGTFCKGECQSKKVLSECAGCTDPWTYCHAPDTDKWS